MNVARFAAVAAVLSAAISTAPLLSGCASFATMVAGMATNKTGDLSQVSVQTRYVSNFYPKDAATYEMAYMTKDWKEGDNGVTLTFLKKQGAGLIELDGTVAIDGEPMDYMGLGSYAKSFSGKDAQPHKITVTTKAGQVAEYTVQPPQSAELTKVNGADGDAKVDLSKDMTLEFANVPAKPAFVRVTLLTEAMGMRSFSDIGVYKLEKSMKIPAPAFMHPTINGGVTLRSNTRGQRSRTVAVSRDSIIVPGSNYVLVEQFDVDPVTVAGLPAAQNVALGWSWKPVTVTGKVPTEPGLEISGNLPKEKGALEYFVEKPNASIGKPLSAAKKFAITSLNINGVLYRKNVKEHGGVMHSAVTGTTTTWAEFPEVPLAYWDKALDNVYEELTTMFKKDFNITVIPVEQVIAAKAYQDFEVMPDVLTKEEIKHPYKGLRTSSPQGPDSKLITSTFLNDRVETKLMNELGVDGLVEVNITIDLPLDRKLKTVTSKIEYRIIGAPKDYVNATVFASGEVVDNEGLNYTPDSFQELNSLTKAFRQKDLVAGIRQALIEQEAKAKELGYEKIWNAYPNTRGVAQAE